VFGKKYCAGQSIQLQFSLIEDWIAECFAPTDPTAFDVDAD